MANTPQNINPVGNTIPLLVTSSNNLEQSGIHASLAFTFSPPSLLTTSMELSLFGDVLHFDFVHIPDNTGLELYGWDGTEDEAEWFAKFLDDFKANYHLSSYFNITDNGDDSVQLLAKNAGSEFNLSFYGATLVNITNNVVVLGKNELSKPNFGIHARIIDTSNGNVLGEDRIAAGASALFDFHEYLKGWTYSDIFFPEGTGFPLPRTTAVKEFYIEHWEQATDYVSKVTRTNNIKAICGGINKTHEQLISVGVAEYIDLFKSGDILLQTARPLNSYVSLNQPLHFYIINNLEAARSITALIMLYYTDGTTHNMQEANTLLANAWEQCVFLVSPSLIRIEEANPEKTIQRFTVQIVTTETEVSQVFNFIVKESTQEKVLCVKNSFGTFDYIPFFGISEIQDKYARITFENSNNELSLLDVNENENLVLNSGWVSKETRDWYRDLLQSRQVYIINGDVLEPYVIATGESLRHKDKEHLYGLVVKLQKSLSDNYYSRERNLIPDGATSGFVIGTTDYIIGTRSYDIGIY